MARSAAGRAHKGGETGGENGSGGREVVRAIRRRLSAGRDTGWI